MIRHLAVLLFFFLASCASDHSSHTAALDHGFGGTGLTQCAFGASPEGGDSGFGGTGHTSECGMGGTGVIGTITDFGSIWVNGLEIELAPNLKVTTNLGGTTSLGIGHQVVTLATPDAQGRPTTNQVQVFYAIAGRISARSESALIISGQTVRLDKETQGLRQAGAGDWVAVSALPLADGRWLATRIDDNPHHIERITRPQLSRLNTPRALVQGTILHKNGQPILAPYGLPIDESAANKIHEGALAVVAVRHAADHWQIERLETLRHWRVDWRQLHEQVRQGMLGDSAMHGPEAQRHHDATMHDEYEQTKHLHEQRGALHEAREQNESLREQQDMMRQSQELNEQRETFRDMREMQHSDQDSWR